MDSSFWAQCEGVIAAIRENRRSEALRLLDLAEGKVDQAGISGDLLSSRREHIELLRSTLGGAINILFVLPDSVDSPCGFEVLNVAKGLASQKMKCSVAVSEINGNPKGWAGIPVKSFSDIKVSGPGFLGGRKPDIIHAWTAQEKVLEFANEMREKHSAKLVIHIENNEEYLTEKIIGQPWEKLQVMPVPSPDKVPEKIYFHPHHGISWLSKADGFTFALDTLRRFNMTGVPSKLLPPTVDEHLFYPRPLNTALRDKLGIPRDHTVIVYPGNVRAVNQDEVRQLYQAVEELNRQGTATTLIRTGRNRNQRVLAEWPNTNVKDLGWVPRNELPEVMAAADIFVQPGEPGVYNDQRIPHKLLEYFALGRPVILPSSNLGLKAKHGQDAYVSNRVGVDEIVKAIAEIKSNQGLYDLLSKGAADFYLKQVNHCQCENLVQLYRGIFSKKKIRVRKPVQQASIRSVAKHANTSAVDQSNTNSAELAKLTKKLSELEQNNIELSKRLRSMPSIDPLCVEDPSYAWPTQEKEDFGIIVFGHTRLDTLEAVLESLQRQDAIKYTEVWLDGHQGNHKLKVKNQKVIELVNKYPVKFLNKQNGNFGFRKMLILGLVEMCRKYKDILILEDDCFPTRDAVAEFRKELDLVRNDNGIFSVYGHHFLVEGEKDTCARFQGWGWATTREKLFPMLRQLIDCYSMSEQRYLDFVKLVLTPDIKARIDIMHPRQPSYTLKKFFAWDETLCLLSALNKQAHKPTRKRTIYNCGMDLDSAHFKDNHINRKPPFNLITPDEVWQYF